MGRKGVERLRLGLLDDEAPDGSPNTACQMSLEAAIARGEVVIEEIEIRPGVFEARMYRVIPGRGKRTRAI